MSARIDVSTAMRDYEVVVGRGLLATSSSLLPAPRRVRRALVVTDDNVAPLYLEQ